MATAPNLPESIAAQLRNDILDGTYKAGERLPAERDLASRLGVNRGSVREALKKLEQMGLVVIRRGDGATVRHLLAERDQLHRYSDVRSFTSQDRTRLEVLASDSDPHVSAAFSERDYRDTVAILERFYNLVLTDCGTGLLHDAMRGILGLASSLVVVSSASLDGARSASATSVPVARMVAARSPPSASATT